MSMRFPEWNSEWKTADVVKTLAISGRFSGGGKFREIPVEKAESHFGFTNFVWTLPDLTIKRPEGEARLRYIGNVRNGDFSCDIESRIDPGILKVLAPEEHRAAAGVVKFVQPPLLVGRRWDWVIQWQCTHFSCRPPTKRKLRRICCMLRFPSGRTLPIAFMSLDQMRLQFTCRSSRSFLNYHGPRMSCETGRSGRSRPAT